MPLCWRNIRPPILGDSGNVAFSSSCPHCYIPITKKNLLQSLLGDNSERDVELLSETIVIVWAGVSPLGVIKTPKTYVIVIG